MSWAFIAAVVIALILLASISRALEQIASKLDLLVDEAEGINSSTRSIDSELSRIVDEVKNIDKNVQSIDIRLIGIEGSINSIDNQIHDLILLQISHSPNNEASSLEGSDELPVSKKRYP